MNLLKPEVAIWASLFLNLIPIGVLWVVSHFVKRLNEKHDTELHDIKTTIKDTGTMIQNIDKKYDEKWDEHMKLHVRK